MASDAFGRSSELSDLIRAYADLYERGQLSQAEPVASNAVDMARRDLGETDVRVAVVLRDLAEIKRALGDLPEALRLNSQALALTEAALGKDHRDVAALLLDQAEIYRSLGRFSEAEQAFERAVGIDQNIFANRGFESGPGGAGLGGLGPKMINSVYDFFERKGGELNDYGRYTYVLIPNPSPRVAELLGVLLETTRSGETVTFDRRKLNVFYMPVKDGYQDRARDLSTRQVGSAGAATAAAPIAGAYYDYDFATDLLSRLCDTAAESRPSICESALSDGPYLVTLSKRIGEHLGEPGPFLVLDLSRIHPGSFRKFVDEVKIQVKQPDFTQLERIEQTKLKLLSLVLVAGDWVGAVKPAVAEVIEMVAPLLKK